MPRGIKGTDKKNCARCDELRQSKSRYCRKCNANYNREWRKTHKLSDEEKFKDIVRSKTTMRIKRGLLIPYPCEICGKKEVEAHHDDYNKPYSIRWLCFEHHRQHHKEVRNAQKQTTPGG